MNDNSLPPPVTGPSAWTGADLARRPEEWTYRLSPSELAEIDTAANAVRGRDLDIAQITRTDFPLPTLGPVLDRLRGEVLNGRGFVLLRGLPRERHGMTTWPASISALAPTASPSSPRWRDCR